MSIMLTRILQQITGLNTFFSGPNAGRSNGVVLEDSASVTWTTDGQGNVQATATVSGLPVATTAGQVPTSTGAGTTYTAQTPAMTLIQRQTASGGAALTFASIPQTFSNLQLIANFVAATPTDNIALQFNADTTSGHYQWTQLYQNGNVIATNSNTSSATQILLGIGQGTINVLIPGYTSATEGVQTNSTFSCLDGSANINGNLAGNWTGTNVTSITIFMSAGGNINSGVFSLYGLS